MEPTESVGWRQMPEMARYLLFMSLLVCAVFGLIVLVAWVAGFSVEAQVISLVLMGIVLILQLLLFAAAHYSAADETESLLRYSRYYVSRMVSVMKIGTTILSLLCMLVLMGYSFLFLDFRSPWVVGLGIMLAYAGIFSCCLIIPGGYYLSRICLSSRDSPGERRVVRVAALAVSLVVVTVVLGVWALVTGRLAGWFIVLLAVVVVLESLMLNYEVRRAAAWVSEEKRYVFSALFWVVLALHMPYWAFLIWYGGGA